MTFDPDAPPGQGVLLPCKSEVIAFEDLVEEARALWKAEDQEATGEKDLGKSWGCVGAMFGDRVSEGFRDQLREIFIKRTITPVEPFNQSGVLEIPWPCYEDGGPVDYDIILAASNKGEKRLLSPEAIADAWIEQNRGYEQYFFNNIREGIRTHEDLAIWHRIQAKQPPWLGKPEYDVAVKNLW